MWQMCQLELIQAIVPHFATYRYSSFFKLEIHALLMRDYRDRIRTVRTPYYIVRVTISHEKSNS